MKRPYEDLIIAVPDYPKPGVTFQDITPILNDPAAFRMVVDDIAEHFAGRGITKVMGAEARGFIVGAPVAYALATGFVPARKSGKLPRETVSASYDLEYGSDELEIHADALTSDDVVLIADDLMATGGTAMAMADLVHASGAKLAGMAFLMELTFLNPRDAVARSTDAEIFSLIKI